MGFSNSYPPDSDAQRVIDSEYPNSLALVLLDF